jgi:hypothetical protein
MSNLFEQVLTDVNGVEKKLLGPTYPYYKNIKTPSQIGMSDKGTIQQMSKNVNGLVQYVELLVTGKSKASTTGRPLGNKFFLQTGAKCAAIDSCTDRKDLSTCKQVDRYIYVNNVPEGNIPFISSGLGVNFSEFKGLIPGAMGNLNVLNPFGIMRAFLSGSNPPCQQINLQTITSNNIKSSESHYVTLADINNMDPCIFSNKKNPVTRKKCRETFCDATSGTSLGEFDFKTDLLEEPEVLMPTDPLAQVYFSSLGVVGLYILYRLMEKS